MNCDFNFNLVNSQKKSIRLLANGILVINAIVLLYITYKLSYSKYYYIRITFIVVLAALDIYAKRKDWLYHTGALMLVFIGWLLFNYWWVGVIMIALSLFAELAVAQKRICFEDKSISTNTVFGKTYNWDNLQNVVLKDGLLTLDFKNNKIFQVYLKDDTTKETEQKFNEYCKSKINLVSKNYTQS